MLSWWTDRNGVAHRARLLQWPIDPMVPHCAMALLPAPPPLPPPPHPFFSSYSFFLFFCFPATSEHSLSRKSKNAWSAQAEIGLRRLSLVFCSSAVEARAMVIYNSAWLQKSAKIAPLLTCFWTHVNEKTSKKKKQANKNNDDDDTLRPRAQRHCWFKSYYSASSAPSIRINPRLLWFTYAGAYILLLITILPYYRELCITSSCLNNLTWYTH